MRNFFVTLYKYFRGRKFFLFSILVIIVIISAILASRLRMDENILSVMPQNKETDRINFVFRNINSADKIIFKISQADTTVESDPDMLIDAAEQLAAQLEKLKDDSLIDECNYMVDESQIADLMDFIYENLPYFLTDDDYARIDTLLTREKIAATLKQDREMLATPMAAMYRQSISADPLHLAAPILEQMKQFQLSSQYTTYDGYIFSKDMKSLILFVTPHYSSGDTYHNKLLVEKIDEILANQDVTAAVGAKTTYFGAAAVAVANAEQIKKDSTLSVIIALTLVTLLLAFYFRSARPLLLVLLPTAFGGLFAIAVVSLIKGTISAIALGTGAIIFGIAIDYSLHFLIHFREQPRVDLTIREVAFPLIVGSTTTIAAFLSLIFLHSELLSDFGLFASFSLIGTIIFTLIFLPHFLKDNDKALYSQKHYSVWNRIADYSIENNKIVVWGVVILTCIFTYFSGFVEFESDMHKINYMTESQKAAFKELSKNTTLSQQLTYIASEGKDLEEALQNNEKLNSSIETMIADGTIKSCSCIGNFLPSKELQQKRIDNWNNFTKENAAAIKQMIIEKSRKAGFAEGAFESFYSTLEKEFQIKEKDDFAPIYDSFLKEFIIEKEGRAAVIAMAYSSPDQSETIRNTVEANAGSFTFDTTTLTKNMLSELQFDFNYLLWICGIIVLIFLFLSFGSIEITLITFLPMTVAFIWILGLMALFGIKFNIINIILATFIFGIGDDYSIFIMEGLIYEYAYGKKMLSTYKTAVILSAVTMFIGIGALIVAKHPAMFSLAQVTIIGMVSVALIAYIVAPVIFKWLITRRGQLRKTPITLWNLLKTIYAFTIFLFFSIITTLVGFFMLTVLKNNKKNKYLFHRYLCGLLNMLEKMMPQVKNFVRNPNNEDFKKPGIIIANHQSQLDLLYLLALNPKIICLTNHWVWHNPFYGFIIRYADFYPVENGIEQTLPQLRQAIQDGYSILVFPEGTRSTNCDILKFHQGAFYLAKALNIDLIPVLIHGIGHIFPKHEFILRKGSVTVKILDRISAQSPLFTESEKLNEVAKQMRKFFIEEYKIFSTETETADYFAETVRLNFAYKGKNIASSVRKSMRKNKNFAEKIAGLPMTGVVEIKDEGYGEFALTAALVRKELQITAIMRDEDAMLVAQNCAIVPENLKFKVE